MFTMTLNDGTKLEGLRIINSTIYSDKPVTADMLRGKLSPVSIDGAPDDDTPYNEALWGYHHHMEIVSISQENGKSAICLREVPELEWELKQIKAYQAFIAMMTDVNL